MLLGVVHCLMIVACLLIVVVIVCCLVLDVVRVWCYSVAVIVGRLLLLCVVQ